MPPSPGACPGPISPTRTTTSPSFTRTPGISPGPCRGLSLSLVVVVPPALAPVAVFVLASVVVLFVAIVTVPVLVVVSVVVLVSAWLVAIVALLASVAVLVLVLVLVSVLVLVPVLAQS